LPLLLALGCPSPAAVGGRAGPGPLDEAAVAVKAGRADARQQALYGWQRHLVAGDAAGALEAWRQQPDHPLSLLGQLDLARRAGAPHERAALAARLAVADSQGPLGQVAAHVMLDLAGTSPALDVELARGADQALAQRPSPQVAFLLRLLRARIAENQDDPTWQARFADAGAVQELALGGPFGAQRSLDFFAPLPPTVDGQVKPSYPALGGTAVTRTVRFPTGDVRLFGEPERGDVYFLASDFTARGGAYLLHVGAVGPFVAYVDGKALLTRAPFQLGPGQRVVSLPLAAGPHRLVLRMSRAEGGSLAAFIYRADGTPEAMGFHAAGGAAPVVAPPPAGEDLPLPPVGAEALAAALAPLTSEPVARYMAARDGLGRDPEGAKALVEALVDGGTATAPVLLLRAVMTLGDHSLPERTARARAGKDIEQAAVLDPGEASAWLMASSTARDEDRLDDAWALLQKARAAAPKSPLVELTEARIHLARNIDALAEAAAQRVLLALPGHCEATELRYDLARRAESMAAEAQRFAELAGCPGQLERTVDRLRSRGDLAGAAAAQERRLAASPASWRTAAELSHLLVAQHKLVEAEKPLQDQVARWPRQAELHKKLAELKGLQGDLAAEKAEREKALALDGSDLTLRRAMSLAAGHELLDGFAIDSEQAIAAYQLAGELPGVDKAADVLVLDQAGIQAFPDGTQLERIHTIFHVLDQRAISPLAEQKLPGSAVVLRMQTRKKDGRVLEPEAIDAKDSISLANVEVGDFVDVEYVSMTASRSLAEPGYTSVPFFFRVAGTPLFRSTFAFQAPPGAKLEVDAHHMEPPAIEATPEGPRVSVVREKVPLHIPEPNSVGGAEHLPWVQVGVGSGLVEGLLPFADSLIGHDQPTREVAAFAKKAAADKVGVDAVRAVFGAVMEAVKGEGNDLGDRASMTLARERGSRLWLLQGALKALGVTTHVALVRPAASDPSPRRFAATDLYTYAALYVELPQQAPLWLDPSMRWSPFNRLPEGVTGGRDALVLPQPGEAMRQVKTPTDDVTDTHQVRYALTLDAAGDVVGQGEETYSGFEAASIWGALDRLNEQQRRQAVEVGLARSVRGAQLDTLEVVGAPAVGAPVTLRYAFKAKKFARATESGLELTRPLSPASLGPRFVALSQRTTPMFISRADPIELSVTMEAPGLHPVDVPAPIQVQGPFGRFSRAARADGAKLVLTESLSQALGRVAPDAYGDYVKFAASVDQAQVQPLRFGK
jgi:hypothetical protein